MVSILSTVLAVVYVQAYLYQHPQLPYVAGRGPRCDHSGVRHGLVCRFMTISARVPPPGECATSGT